MKASDSFDSDAFSTRNGGKNLTDFQKRKAKYFFNVNLDIENKGFISWDDVEFYILFHMTAVGRENDEKLQKDLTEKTRAIWDGIKALYKDDKSSNLSVEQFLDTWASLITHIEKSKTKSLPDWLSNWVEAGFKLYDLKGSGELTPASLFALYAKMGIDNVSPSAVYRVLTEGGRSKLNLDRVKMLCTNILLSDDESDTNSLFLPGFSIKKRSKSNSPANKPKPANKSFKSSEHINSSESTLNKSSVVEVVIESPLATGESQDGVPKSAESKTETGVKKRKKHQVDSMNRAVHQHQHQQQPPPPPPPHTYSTRRTKELFGMTANALSSEHREPLIVNDNKPSATHRHDASASHTQLSNSEKPLSFGSDVLHNGRGPRVNGFAPLQQNTIWAQQSKTHADPYDITQNRMHIRPPSGLGGSHIHKGNFNGTPTVNAEQQSPTIMTRGIESHADKDTNSIKQILSEMQINPSECEILIDSDVHQRQPNVADSAAACSGNQQYGFARPFDPVAHRHASSPWFISRSRANSGEDLSAENQGKFNTGGQSTFRHQMRASRFSAHIHQQPSAQGFFHSNNNHQQQHFQPPPTRPMGSGYTAFSSSLPRMRQEYQQPPHARRYNPSFDNRMYGQRSQMASSSSSHSIPIFRHHHLATGHQYARTPYAGGLVHEDVIVGRVMNALKPIVRNLVREELLLGAAGGLNEPKPPTSEPGRDHGAVKDKMHTGFSPESGATKKSDDDFWRGQSGQSPSVNRMIFDKLLKQQHATHDERADEAAPMQGGGKPTVDHTDNKSSQQPSKQGTDSPDLSEITSDFETDNPNDEMLFIPGIGGIGAFLPLHVHPNFIGPVGSPFDDMPFVTSSGYEYMLNADRDNTKQMNGDEATDNITSQEKATTNDEQKSRHERI